MTARLKAEHPSEPASDPARTVIFAKVLSVGDGTAVVQQTPFEATAEHGSILFVNDDGVGERGSKVTLIISDRTLIQLADGERGLRKGKAATIKALQPGMNVIVMGSAEGQTMTAFAIGDMQAGKANHPKEIRLKPVKQSVTPARGQPQTGGGRSSANLTIDTGSSSLSDTDSSVMSLAGAELGVQSLGATAAGTSTTLASGSMEFKGTAGGPTYTYGYTLDPEVNIFDLGIFSIYLKQFNFTAALGGFIYDYPFDVTVSGSPLKVYSSGSVDVNVKPVSPANGGYSFTGGLGVSADFGLRIHTTIGCGDDGLEACDWDKTAPIGLFSMINSTTAPAAMPGETVNVPIMECPAFGISVPNTPLTLLGGGLCTNISFDGAYFKATITPSGATSPPDPKAIAKLGQFDGTNPVSVPLNPTTGRVGLTLSNFSYVPYMHTGLSFRIVIGVPVYTSPSLGDLASSDFNPIPQTPDNHGDGYCVIPLQCDQPTSYDLAMPAAAAVTSVTPMNGPALNTTRVTVGGGGFNGFTSATGLAVYFGDPSNTANTAALVPPWTDNRIIVDSPSQSAGTVDVYVKTGCGPNATTCLTSDANPPVTTFKYLPKPTVTSVRPVNGPASAEPTGTRDVIITGTGFTTARSVKFGTLSAASFRIVSDSEIVAVQPANTAANTTAAIVDVTVTTACARDQGKLWPNATSCLTSDTNAHDTFTFLPKPTISRLSPATGVSTGNTKLTITGTGFTTAVGVTFGATPALDFNVDSDTQISATVPAGNGKVDVTVTTACGLDQGKPWPAATSCLTSPASAASRMSYVAILALNRATAGAVTLNGGASVAVPNSSVVIDSRHTAALTENGKSRFTALETLIVGGYRLIGSSTITSQPITGAGVMADPFAFLAAPSTSGMTVQGTNLVVNRTTTLQPGIYIGGITISGKAQVTLAPGTYVLQGGGLTLEDQSSVRGNGVLVAFKSSSTTSAVCGGLRVTGGSTLGLTASSATTANPYGGINVYADRACGAVGVAITGNANSMTLGGALYIPNGAFTISGTSATTVGASISDTLVLNQGATLKAQ